MATDPQPPANPEKESFDNIMRRALRVKPQELKVDTTKAVGTKLAKKKPTK